MDSPNLTRLAMIRLKSRHQPLEHLAFKLILRNLDFYLKSDGEESIELLPAVLKDKLLQDMLKPSSFKQNSQFQYFEIALSAFPKLLSKRTRRIDLEGLLLSCQEYCKNASHLMQLFNDIAEKAPNVEYLIISTGRSYCKVRYIRAFEEVLVAIKKMKRLKILIAEQQKLTRIQFLDLCSNLPGLRILSLDWIYYARFDEADKKIINNLRLIVGGLHNTRELSENLSYLDVVDCFSRYGLDSRDLEVPTDSCFFRSYFVGSLRLRDSDPDVTHLRLEEGTKYDATPEVRSRGNNLHLQFPQVKSLTIGPSENSFENVFLSFGKRLETLILNDHALSFSWEDVSKLCPRLKKLSLTRCVRLKPGAKHPNEPFFPQLRELELTEIYWGMPVENMLCSPNLQRVVANGFQWDNDVDINILIDLIKEGKILRQLRTFHICIGHTLLAVVNFQETANFIKYASAYLPNLVDVKFSFELGYDYQMILTDETKFDRIMALCNHSKINPDILRDEDLITILKTYENNV